MTLLECTDASREQVDPPPGAGSLVFVPDLAAIRDDRPGVSPKQPAPLAMPLGAEQRLNCRLPWNQIERNPLFSHEIHHVADAQVGNPAHVRRERVLPSTLKLRDEVRLAGN